MRGRDGARADAAARGGTLYAALDGGAESATASGNTQVLTGTVRVGTATGAAGTFLDGRIGEIAVYNTALTGTALTDAVTYFTDKWLPHAVTITVRATQGLVEALITVPTTAADVRHTQGLVEALYEQPNPALEATQALLEVLVAPPPEGGGDGAARAGPPVVDAQTGRALRLFVEIKGRTPVTPGAEVPRSILAAETGLRDPATWHGGHKPARLVSV